MRGEAFGAVPDGVESGHVGEQRLRGADVRRRLFAADVLFAGLQRHAVGGIAVHVDRDADDAAGDLADELFAGGEEGGVRAAVAHGHAEALGISEDHVGAHFAGRGEQRQAEQIGGDGDQNAVALRLRR